MSNHDESKISYGKATAFARVITNVEVRVQKGNVPGPCTDGKKTINLGPAEAWEPVDRFAAIIHECCHVIYPAKYPAGNLRQTANMIDDCRIERQFIAARPHYSNALEVLATNVIANGKYDEEQVDRFSAEKFDPALWVILFFRNHVDQEIRQAATEAVNAYSAAKGYTQDPTWQPKFDKLVDDGLPITRLKSVSQDTLTKWCTDYYLVFPDAHRDPTPGVAVAVFNDAGSGSDSKDADGAGSPSQDAKDAKNAKGKGSKGSETKPDQVAPDVDDLDGAIDRLKERMGSVGTEKDREAKNDHAPDADGLEEGPKGDDDKDEDGEGKGGKDKGDKDDDKFNRWLPPGQGDYNTPNAQRPHSVDRNVTIRLKMAVRKLQHLAEDRVEQDTRTGRLNFHAIIRADALDLVAPKPFISEQDDTVFCPVACCVATDSSGATGGEMNPRLNEATHNMLFSLQAAGCENSSVVWNSGATIVKRIDEDVSALSTKWHGSGGGTELMAAAAGSIRPLNHP